MRTNKCAIIVIAFFCIFIFSMVFSEWLIIVFMLPLLFLLFGSVLSFYSEKIDIEVVRNLSNVKIFENDKIEVTLNLKNNGDSIGFLELYDTLPGKVKVARIPAIIASTKSIFISNATSAIEPARQ